MGEGWGVRSFQGCLARAPEARRAPCTMAALTVVNVGEDKEDHIHDSGALEANALQGRAAAANGKVKAAGGRVTREELQGKQG